MIIVDSRGKGANAVVRELDRPYGGLLMIGTWHDGQNGGGCIFEKLFKSGDT